MEQTQKKLSAALNNFVNVLVEEGLEPIRLDIIRIENDLIEQIKSSILEEVDKRILALENAISELKKNTHQNSHVSQETDSSFNDKKFDSLKTSIDNLASKVSEVFETKKTNTANDII